MKIGILIDRLSIGGVEKVAIEEVKTLRKLKENAVLLVLSEKSVVKGALSDMLDGIPIVYLNRRLPKILRFIFKVPFFYFFSFFHLFYPFFIPLVVKKNEFDVILSHNTYTSFTALTLSKFIKVPYAVFIWDPISYILKQAYPSGPIKKLSPILLPLARFLDSLIIRNSIVVFLSSNFHKKYLLELLKQLKINIVLVPQGVDVEKRLKKQRGKHILTLTAWKYGKGLESLIDVVSNIKSAKLRVVGKWIHKGYFLKIKKLIKSKKLTNRIKIIPNPSQVDLRKEYSNARVTVIINREKGFGLPALEAAANGCTFVIPDDCGVADFFKHGIDGYYFKYGDINSMKNYIKKLLSNERLAYNMGKHAWITTKNKYSKKRHVTILLNGIKNNLT